MTECSTDIKASSDEIFEVRCEPCTGIVNAEHFCMDCVSFMCNSCRKNHDLFLKGHVFEDKKCIPKDLFQMMCQKHACQALKYYCLKCNVFICDTCTQLEHSSCGTMINSVPSLAKGFGKSMDFNDYTGRLNAIVKKLENLEISNAKTLSEIELNRDKAINDIETLRDEITSKLAKLSEDLRNVVELEANTSRAYILSAATNQAEFKEELHTLKNNLERKQSNGENCLLFKISKDHDLHDKETVVEGLEKAGRIVPYSYQPSDEIEKIRKLMKSMTSFGTFKQVEEMALDTLIREKIRSKMLFFKK